MPVVTYSLLRLALLLLAAAGLWLAGMRGWLVPLVAAVVAFVLSYVVFGRQRDAAARWLAARAEERARRPRRPSGADLDAVDEDAEADRSTP